MKGVFEMNKNNNKMDLLGNAPVPQALMALGIPIMIGMLINALYNLVDYSIPRFDYRLCKRRDNV